MKLLRNGSTKSDLCEKQKERIQNWKQADCGSLVRGNHNLKHRDGLGDWGTWAYSRDNYEKKCPDIGDQLDRECMKDQIVHSDSQVSVLMDCMVPFNEEGGPG